MMERMEEKEEKLLTEQRTTEKSEEFQQQQYDDGLEKSYRGEDDVVEIYIKSLNSSIKFWMSTITMSMNKKSFIFNKFNIV